MKKLPLKVMSVALVCAIAFSAAACDKKKNNGGDEGSGAGMQETSRRGQKITDAFRKEGLTVNTGYAGMMQSRSYEQAASLADDLMDMYLNGHLDKVVLTYTHFKSAGSQQIVDEVLLPVTVPAGEAEQESDYILEPSAAELMKVLLPKVIRMKVYCAMLDSFASEQAARVIAMQAATENADNLIGELTLQYNKLRQQAITNEILDLAAGAQNQ